MVGWQRWWAGRDGELAGVVSWQKQLYSLLAHVSYNIPIPLLLKPEAQTEFEERGNRGSEGIVRGRMKEQGRLRVLESHQAGWIT